MSERVDRKRYLQTMSDTLLIGATTVLLAAFFETKISWTVEAWLVERWTFWGFLTRHWLLVLGLILGALGALLRIVSDE